MPARFTTNATTDALRAALIDDDVDNLTLDLIVDVVQAYPDIFEAMARSHLSDVWANAADVWDEAADRGYFTADHDD